MNKNTLQTVGDSRTLAEQAVEFRLKGDFHSSIRVMRQLTEMEPDEAAHWNDLGSSFCCVGVLDDGLSCFETAHALNPEDAATTGNLKNALMLKMQQSLASSDLSQRLDACRRLIAVDPSTHPARLNLFEALTDSGQRALLSDFDNQLTETDIGTKILIACMPKSGSTWLFTAMKSLTGFVEDRYSQGFMQNEQEIYLPRVVESAREDAVIQQHCRATNPNVSIMQGFGMRPVVLIRNLFDTLVSKHDFYDNGAVRNTFYNEGWNTLDPDTRLDLMVENIAPWYIQFYAS